MGANRAAMTTRLLAIMSTASMLTAVACLPSDVEASDYDQTCASDEDCVAVAELSADGTTCSTGCSTHTINKKDLAQYEKDLAASQSDCSAMRGSFCDVTAVPACVGGRCEMKEPPPEPASSGSFGGFGGRDGG